MLGQWVRWVEPKLFHVVWMHMLVSLYQICNTYYWVGKSINPLIYNNSFVCISYNRCTFYHTLFRDRHKYIRFHNHLLFYTLVIPSSFWSYWIMNPLPNAQYLGWRYQQRISYCIKGVGYNLATTFVSCIKNKMKVLNP